MGNPMTKHQNSAQHNDPYEDQPMSSGTGGLRNNDNDAPEAGKGHVHTSDPSKGGEHDHGSHGHSDMKEHHEGGSHGHKDMHEHHPKHHHGGHKKY